MDVLLDYFRCVFLLLIGMGIFWLATWLFIQLANLLFGS